MVLLRYLALSGLGIALFYLIDRLILRKSMLLKTQRYYYLIAIVASLALPLVTEITPSWQSQVVEVVEIPTFTITLEDEFVVTPEESKSIDWWAVAQMVWYIGVVITGIWLLVGMVRIWLIQRRSERRRLSKGVTLYLTQEEIAPFTFGKDIYIPRSLSEPTIIDSVLLHELEHIQQRHYIDMLLGFVLQLVQWWNPFAWSMLQQQRNTLEYLADQGVLRQGKDRKTYQYHLLECTIGRSVQVPSLSFSMQNLKQRIVMMNSNKKGRKSLAVIYAIAALPIVALLLLGTQMVTIKQAIAAETPDVVSEVATEVAPPPADEDIVFERLEDMPEYPGGLKALMKYLNDNVKYPEEANQKNIQGNVVVSFIVERDGSVSNVTIKKSAHKLLDDEAIRVVSAMPKWKPGTQDGKAVRCRFALPVNFSLKSKKADGNNGTVFEYLDNFPEYPGGTKEMVKFLSENTRYPAEAVKQRIQGRVMVSFIVETDGSLSDIKVVRGVHELLDAEAIRVVSSMPKWKPGTDNEDKPVRARFTLPVQFMLSGNEAPTPKKSDKSRFAEFPEGFNQMFAWVKSQIVYPKDALDKKIEGTPIVSFVVLDDGAIRDIKLKKSAYNLLDEEALRVIKSMPKWNPATAESDRKVMEYDVAIPFRLDGQGKPSITQISIKKEGDTGVEYLMTDKAGLKH